MENARTHVAYGTAGLWLVPGNSTRGPRESNSYERSTVCALALASRGTARVRVILSLVPSPPTLSSARASRGDLTSRSRRDYVGRSAGRSDSEERRALGEHRRLDRADQQQVKHALKRLLTVWQTEGAPPHASHQRGSPLPA